MCGKLIGPGLKALVVDYGVDSEIQIENENLVDRMNKDTDGGLSVVCPTMDPGKVQDCSAEDHRRNCICVTCCNWVVDALGKRVMR